jgi:hypothetical protein
MLWVKLGYKVRFHSLIELIHWDVDIPIHSGLLMARTYAISQKEQAVLAVLGLLFLGSFIPNIVCDHTLVASVKI